MYFIFLNVKVRSLKSFCLQKRGLIIKWWRQGDNPYLLKPEKGKDVQFVIIYEKFLKRVKTLKFIKLFWCQSEVFDFMLK
jgi:hypothetical protein